MGEFGAFGRKRFVVKLLCLFGVKSEVKLVFPAEFESGFRQSVVAVLSSGMALGEVGGVSGELVRDNALFDVLFVRQAEMFFRRDVTERCRAGRLSRSSRRTTLITSSYTRKRPATAAFCNYSDGDTSMPIYAFDLNAFEIGQFIA